MTAENRIFSDCSETVLRWRRKRTGKKEGSGSVVLEIISSLCVRLRVTLSTDQNTKLQISLMFALMFFLFQFFFFPVRLLLVAPCGLSFYLWTFAWH
jgi:hypothetical protein